MDLRGKTAVVTGAGSGVGRELARVFARAGAYVACCGRRESKLKETVTAITDDGGVGLVVPTDVADYNQVLEMVKYTRERFGVIDILFNNAGSFGYVGPIWEADLEVWWRDVTVNLLGSMHCCRAVLPHMIERKSGVIINMDGGGGSLGPNVGGSAYGCSKVALCRFTEGLARELEREGHPIQVFCMMPGLVRTEMTDHLVDSPEKMKWQGHVIKLRGTSAEFTADACAKATIKLLRIASPELNGRIFYVDTDYVRIGKSQKKIREEDLYVLHLTTLDGVLGEWPTP